MARELGGLDVLVNNAGVAGPTGFVETLSKADWDRTLAVNITGQFLCARQAIPLLKASKAGVMINLSSAAGHLGFAGRSVYSASKWAVIGFTKSLAIELGPHGIRVNAILPGAVEGPRIRAVIAAKAETLGKPVEEIAALYENQAAMGRMVTARDIANMVLFNASEAARSVSGRPSWWTASRRNSIDGMRPAGAEDRGAGLLITRQPKAGMRGAQDCVARARDHRARARRASQAAGLRRAGARGQFGHRQRPVEVGRVARVQGQGGGGFQFRVRRRRGAQLAQADGQAHLRVPARQLGQQAVVARFQIQLHQQPQRHLQAVGRGGRPAMRGRPRVSAWAMDRPPLSKPSPLSRIMASTARSKAGVGRPVPAAASAWAPSSSRMRRQPSASNCAARGGLPPYILDPPWRRHCSASNFLDTASPSPARKKAAGALAMTVVSTSTMVGLNSMCSTASRLWSASYST